MGDSKEIEMLPLDLITKADLENHDAVPGHVDGTNETKPDRGNWTGRFDYLMSLIAYAVGLGNVWRFPYLCFKNGGGAFFIPYIICWFFAAMPVFLMEAAAGQYLQRGGIGVWKVCPLFKGVGFANIIISFMCTVYYGIIIAWSLFYLFSSFREMLPWVNCDHDFNDVRCLSQNTNSTNLTWLAKLIEAGYTMNDTQTPAEQFWEREVLQTTDSIEDTGYIQWRLLLLLILSWVLVYFALWKGIVHARKLVYFCALCPYLLLIILLGRGCSLPGAGLGITYYLKPNMSKLLSTTVWRDAGTQVFYSYGIGFGAISALGSYNTYHHNCYADTLVLCAVNPGTSIIGGLVVFSVLGHLAYVAKKTVGEVVKSGVGLAFLIYPEVVAILPVSQIWSFLFFLMITILGLDSQVCMVGTIVTAMSDSFPRIVRKHQQLFVLGLCVFTCLLGLTMVTQAGQYWLTLIDGYGASGYTLLIVVFFEVIGFSWGFGGEKLYKALQDMLGFKITRLWLWSWKYTAPAISVLIFLFTMIKYEPLEMAPGRAFPSWAEGLGFLMSLSSILMIPGVAVYLLYKSEGTINERFQKLLVPKDSESCNDGILNAEESCDMLAVKQLECNGV